MDIRRLAGLAAAVTAISTALGIGYAVADYTEVRPIIKREFVELSSKVEDHQKFILLNKFTFLNEKRKRGGLTPAEKVELCQIADILKFKDDDCK